MKRLIINADDFGLHKEVNIGIIKGYQDGCITSTSIMPGGRAFEHAVALLEDNAGLGVGVHLTLVVEKTVADVSKVRTLVNSEGFLSAGYPEFMKKYILGKFDFTEIKNELEAQVAKVVAAGVQLTHLDSHQHLHVLPGILEIVLAIAHKYKIPAVRIPCEPYFFTGGYPAEISRIVSRIGLSFLAQQARRTVQQQGFLAPQHFFGMLAGGNLKRDYLLNIVNNLPEGDSEIMMHPGNDDRELGEAFSWKYHWQQELAAVQSVELKDKIDKEKIKLISFRELANV